MFKKFIASVLIAVFIFFSTFVPIAKAQVVKGGLWYSPTFAEYVTKVFDKSNETDIFGERYTYAQVSWIVHSLTAVIIPPFILNCLSDMASAATCLASAMAPLLGPLLGIGYDTTQDINLAYVVNQITLTSPASGIGYIRDTLTKLSLVPQAKAQGFGFQTLAPIRTIWTSVRNVSYFLMVLAFIIMAFLVMFRMKTSPQTVITVQSAIPRMIMILILVTFSYAIAGFVIDLSFLSVGLVAIAGSAGGISSLGPLDLFSKLLSGHPMVAMFVIVFLAPLLFIFTGGLEIAAFGLIMILIETVILFIIIIAFVVIWFRIFWLMLKSFINVILYIIAAPIIILTGVFPASGGFGSWLKGLASHVAVFPLIIIMFFLAHFFFWSNVEPSGVLGALMGALAYPYLNPYGIALSGGGATMINLPGFQLGSSDLFGFVAAVGTLFLIPSVGNIIQSTLSGKPFGYGSGIGAAFAPFGYAWGAGPVRTMREAYSKEAAGEALKRLGGTLEKYRRTTFIGGRMRDLGEKVRR